MKTFLLFLTVLSFLSCTTKDNRNWDGAQRQEAIEDERQFEQQDQLRNQFPGARTF